VAQAGAVAKQGYTFRPRVQWGIKYMPVNFPKPTTGPLFKQLYIRQERPMTIHPPGFVKDLFKGLGWPTNDPVPPKPSNPYVSSYTKSTAYKYSPTKAANLLKSHGWTVSPDGVSVCNGSCGTGVSQGAKLEFKLEYATGDTIVSQEVQAWKSAA